MKYLVTGGLGVVGSRFVEIVSKGGHEVTVLDAAEEPRNHWMAENFQRYLDVTVIKQRIEKFEGLDELISNQDAIVHAGAHTGIPHSEKDPDDDWISNVDASRRILESLRSQGLKIPIVMLSSVKPYDTSSIPTMERQTRFDWSNDFKGVDENFLLDPDEPYAASKMAQSALGISYARSYDIPVTVLRCSNLYGDAPCHGPRHGWLTWFCISAALDWEIELQGTGKQTRDMLFSDDVTTAVLAAFENINDVKGKVFNIGGGVSNTISCKDAVSYIERLLGRDVKARSGPGRENEDMLFVTNYEKFYSATGWSPLVPLEEGISKILNWANEHKSQIENIYSEILS